MSRGNLLAPKAYSYQRRQDHIVVKFETDGLGSADLETQHDRYDSECHKGSIGGHHGARLRGEHDYEVCFVFRQMKSFANSGKDVGGNPKNQQIPRARRL